jgi:electron transfer flavoprotein alpha subunit
VSGLGPILFVAEHADGAPRKSAYELVSVGRVLAEATGRPLAAVVVGAEVDGVAAALAAFVPDVYAMADERLEPPRAETMTRAVAHAVSTLGASVVLVPGSRAGQSYGPRVAYRLGAPYLEGVTSLGFEGEELVAKRPTYLSRFSATVSVDAARAVVSVALGTAPVAQGGDAGGAIHALAAPFEPQDQRLEVSRRAAAARRRVALEDADVVVCGGRGLSSAEAFERHAVGLADRLGAGLGVTRAVVDAGWRSFDELIGQTGKTVAPRLCLTLAVSGAGHFLSGMNRSGVIVAVNKDPDAPIFKAADYGIVGDVHEVVPALQALLPDAP